MPRFAANLSLMFPELEPAQRFAAARRCGFMAVEYLRPYEHPLADVQHWVKEAGVELILLNSPLGNPAAGERGLGVLPGREADFRDGLDLTLDYANGLGAGMVHLMAGVVPEGMTPGECEAVFVENLRHATRVAAKRGVKLLLEPLNQRDVPGYLHSKSAHARRIIETVGSDNLYLQYDLYHMQIMEGDIVEGIRRNLDVIGHIQFSCVPGRHEPQHGELNMPYVFDQIDAMGYQGRLGAEYRPKAGTLEGLTWAEPYGIKAFQI
jgi:hydroxypyruvate isomerase